ncbi:MAG: hypothetical protein ABSG20_09560 [Bradyrhizobium sp.]
MTKATNTLAHSTRPGKINAQKSKKAANGGGVVYSGEFFSRILQRGQIRTILRALPNNTVCSNPGAAAIK